MSAIKDFNELIKSKIGCGCYEQNKDPKSKMPGIINDIINNKTGAIVTEIEEKDYNHIYRRKTIWELSRLSFSMMGIEIVYAIITAFVSPILLMYGVKREHATMIWAIGPLIGLIISPVLGSLSDRCKFSIGRRRPFMIFLTTLNILGLLLIANSNDIGKLFGDTEADIFNTKIYPVEDINDENKLDKYFWTVVILVVGAVIVDFGSDTLQNPSRAYVLDVCVVEDHNKVLNSCTLLAGFGGFIGYIIGAIDWQNTFLNKIIGSYVQVVFYLVTILFSISVFTTVTTFRELPLELSHSVESQITNKFDRDAQFQEEIAAIKLQDYLKSIVSMPYSLRILCVTNLFCWMSHITFCLYFTDFVGQVVFSGDPSALPETAEYKQYEEGIRFGCFALCGYSISCIIYSLISEKIIKYLGMKCVYIGTILLETMCLLLMALIKSKVVVVILCSFSGIIYCTIVTIPYMLIAHYHVKKTFNVDRNGKQFSTAQVRGLGTDLAIVGTCLCIAQLVISFSMGKIMSLFGITFAVIGVSTIFALMAAVTACYVVYLDA